MTTLSIVAGLILSAVALEFLPVPFAWLGLIWAGVLAVSSSRSQRGGRGLVLLAGVALLLAAAELLLYAFPLEGGARPQTVRVINGVPGGAPSLRDDVFGYAPPRPASIETTRSIEGEVVYRVTYTIDENGFRRAHPGDGREPGRCLLFVGGSDVFGQGLEDEQTLAWVAGASSGIRTLNLSFNGWGPHQILSAFDRGWIQGVLDCTPSHLVYLANTGHVSRAAGLKWWDWHGPRYVLEPDGSVRLAGHFDDDPIATWLKRTRLRSEIYRNFFGDVGGPGDGDFALFAGIVSAIDERFRAYNPIGEFHVLVWPTHGLEGIERGLERGGIAHSRIGDILEGYEEDRSAYVISDRDSHPNALANRLLAEFVVREIVEGSEPGPTGEAAPPASEPNGR